AESTSLVPSRHTTFHVPSGFCVADLNVPLTLAPVAPTSTCAVQPPPTTIRASDPIQFIARMFMVPPRLSGLRVVCQLIQHSISDSIDYRYFRNMRGDFSGGVVNSFD